MGRRSSILSIWCGTIQASHRRSCGKNLIRRDNPEDKRSQLLYATKKAEGLKNSKVSIESTFYEWLMEELDESETEHFCEMLDRLYLRSKKESRSGFLQVKERMDRGEKDG